MRRSEKLIVAIVISLSLITSVQAQVFKKGLKVGYVNVASVFDKYQKTDEATEVLKKEIETKRKDIEKRRDSINAIKQKLEAQGVVIAEKEKNKMEEEAEARIKELKDITEKFNRELREKETELTKNILKDIEEIVKAYGRDNGYDLILDSREVLYSPEGMEITNDIIKLINEKGKKKKG